MVLKCCFIINNNDNHHYNNQSPVFILPGEVVGYFMLDNTMTKT